MKRWGLAVSISAVVGMLGSARGQTTAPPPLEAYGRLPAAEAVALSADGSRLALVATDGDNRLIMAGDGKGKWYGRWPIGDHKLEDLEWADATHLLIYVRRAQTYSPSLTNRVELPYVLDLDVTKGKGELLFAHSTINAPWISGRLGVFKGADAAYGYYLNVTLANAHTGSRIEQSGSSFLDHDWPGLYKVNLETLAVTRVTEGSETVSNWVLDSKGQIVGSEYFESASGDWKLLSQGKALAKRSGSEGRIDLLGLGRTPTTLLTQEHTKSGGDKVLEYPIDGGAPTSLFEDLAIESYRRDPATGVLIGVEKADAGGPLFFDSTLQARALAARKPFAGRRTRLASYSSDLGQQIIHTEGDHDSGTYWLVDLVGHRADIIDNAYPLVPEGEIGPSAWFDYKAGDGLALRGVLTLPPHRAAKALPLVVLPHGGPIAGGDEPGFDWWAQALASRGYAVLQPNFRGSVTGDQALREAGYGEWGGKMLTDIADGAKALADKGIIDPKRVCIVGASYGGYAALAGVTVQQGLYRCAVAVSGVSDLKAMLDLAVDRSSDHATSVQQDLKVLGVKSPNDPKLDQISPIRLAARADAPILLVHGKDDTVVAFDQSLSMRSALQRGGKTVEFVELAGEDHWLSKSATRIAMLKAVVAFVQKHNPAE